MWWSVGAGIGCFEGEFLIERFALAVSSGSASSLIVIKLCTRHRVQRFLSKK